MRPFPIWLLSAVVSLGVGVPGHATLPEIDSAGNDTSEIAQSTQNSSYTILNVNPAAGSDVQGDGSQMRPYQTITHALRIAGPNTVILLAGGTYSEATGETFPIQLQSGVTVQGSGNRGATSAVIQGFGTYGSSQGVQYVTLVGADQAGLAQITVSNPHPGGVGLWVESGSPTVMGNRFWRSGAVGIYLAGAGAPVIRNNYFSENGTAGLVIAGASAAQVQNNVFENTGIGISVAPTATPQIQENRITRNQDGLILHADARPVLQDNQISRNRRDSILEYGTWADAIAVSTPLPPTGLSSTPATSVAPPVESVLPSDTPTAPAIEAPPVVPTIAVQSLSETDLSATLQTVRQTWSAVDVPEVPMVPVMASQPLFEAVDISRVQAGAVAAIAIAKPPQVLEEALELEETLASASFAPLPTVQEDSQPSLAVGISPETQEPISIPIIPPPVETMARPADPAVNVALPTPTVSGSLPTSTTVTTEAGERLRVPDLSIPLGSGGATLPDLFIAGATISAGAPPAPPSRAATLGLYFKVLVEASDDNTFERVRQQVPDAFRVRLNGQPVIQAGAYPTQEEAQAQFNRLQGLGFPVRIEQIH
jgi:parallel beta-helix repeat protein